MRRWGLVALFFVVLALAACVAGSSGALADNGGDGDHNDNTNTNDKHDNCDDRDNHDNNCNDHGDNGNGNGNGGDNGGEDNGGGGGSDKKITICHATGNGGYTTITISINGLNGHEGHDGDIIPPNDSFPSKNWDDNGQAAWENGCVAPPPPTPPKHPIGVFGSAVCDGAGTYQATFGYTSENDAAVTVPVGSDNFTSPGGQNQGQPTTFQPGTVSSAFTVRGIPIQVKGSWTVSYGGESRSAAVAAPTAGCASIGAPAPAPPRPPVKPITVSVTCVTKGTSTYSAQFGYTNPGSTTLSIPVGSSNGFSPSPAGRGQPIAFEPGTDSGAVTVKGIANGTKLACTVQSGGKTSTATATDSFAVGCATTGAPAPLPPKPVTPYVTCVDAGVSTYSVTYGYSNPNATAATVAVGSNNRFDPAPADRGQPTTFAAGNTSSAVTVTGVPLTTNLVWVLDGTAATATASFPTRCTAVPPQPPASLPVHPTVLCVLNGAGTYEARFGYSNENGVTVPIPVGANNTFSPGAADRGQPTLFGSGVVSYAFTVQGIPNGTVLTWTVVRGGVSHTATASASVATKCPDTSLPPAPPPPPPVPPNILPEPIPTIPTVPTGSAIGVFVQCVTVHGSTYDATYGYQSDNSATVTVAVGSGNRFTPSPDDRGQVSVFQPGNYQSAFTVLAIPAAQALTWSVTYARATRSATATSTFERACNSTAPPPPSAIGLFSCVTPHGSTYDVTFGYDNENPVAINVPIGLSNGVLPLPADRGQPVVFSPGRVTNAFTVKNVPVSRPVVWRVASAGTTLTVAFATQPLKCGTPPTSPGGGGATAGGGSGGGGVSTLPIRVFPLCVVRGTTSYAAVFGYVNPSTTTVRIRRGTQNAVTGAPAPSQQPRAFRPGLAAMAYAVRKVPLGKTVTWTVDTDGHVERAVASTRTVDCTSVALGASDLSVTKTATPAAAAVGARVQYTIVVHNGGSGLKGGVVAVDHPDALLHVLSATTSRGTCAVRSSDQQVTCRIGLMGPGATVTIVVAARTTQTGSSHNSAFVRGSPADPTASNNTASAVVTIGGASSGSGSGPSFTG